jgi:hypothetical protein
MSIGLASVLIEKDLDDFVDSPMKSISKVMTENSTEVSILKRYIKSLEKEMAELRQENKDLRDQMIMLMTTIKTLEHCLDNIGNNKGE